MMTARFRLFYAHAPEDEQFCTELATHLSPLVRQGLIDPWSPKDISPGTPWHQEMHKRLRTAHIILLLVSPHFFHSDYCYKTQVPEALRRQEAGEARVIPILLESCVWEDAPFATLAVLPDNRKPVIKWTNKNDAFTAIAKGIRKVVDDLSEKEETDLEETTRIQEKRTKGRESGWRDVIRTPQSIDNALLDNAVNQCVAEHKSIQEATNHEWGLQTTLQNTVVSVVKHIGWPEMTLDKVHPSGIVLDTFRIPRGYLEAKELETNLEDVIAKKIKNKCSLTNTIFEDSKTAILYQNNQRIPFDFKLHISTDVSDLLQRFLTYAKSEAEIFEEAVDEFKERIPEQAQALLDIIKDQYKINNKFKEAFLSFAKLCRDSLDPNMDDATINETLVQHLLTERLFRNVFNNPNFVRCNIIAAEIEKVIDALASPLFERNDLLKDLDRFYVAIEQAAKGIQSWSQHQAFLNTVYERFFQGFSVKKADTYGIVYTPQEIVDFMVTSVDVVLKQDFGQSIETPNVKILDPATGTGNFIVNIMDRLSNHALEEKYANGLFCNEVMLLPYYIASLNIEHEYYKRIGRYEPFEGICFVDTLTLAENIHSAGSVIMTQHQLFMAEANTLRVQREKDADIKIVIGNPPYNVGQKNENDNNRNRSYPLLDAHIRETYTKASKASNKNALYDVYVKFIRWATDRLKGQDGIVCFISNNSFIGKNTFDGFRKCVTEEFTSIYHVDLGGNAREQGEGNVFNVRVGIGITLFVRNRKATLPPYPPATIYYYKVNTAQNRAAKLEFLSKVGSIEGIAWQELKPDKRYIWITEGMDQNFFTFLPIGSKDAKSAKYLSYGTTDVKTLFKSYSQGAQSGRDNWAYDFHIPSLTSKMKRTIEMYNDELSRWREARSPNIDNFVSPDETKIKWSSRLKQCFARGVRSQFTEQAIRHALYHPFTRQFLYFDKMMTHRQGMFPAIFPNLDTEKENIVICVPGLGDRKGFGCLATNLIANLDLAFEKVQCFPYYIYAEDGSHRRENITDWALKQFQTKYGEDVSKWDIFHYVYGMLHHPQYREMYAENLKHDLPHIPLVLNREKFAACVHVGKQLMTMHVQYEDEKEYPLSKVRNRQVPYDQRLRVEKMKLSPDKTTLTYSKGLMLSGIPQECFEYRLGNRSALEWVIDQYQVSTDKRSGIESDPNRLDDPEYIVRLVKQVVMVSVKTVELVKELAEAVTAEDWASE